MKFDAVAASLLVLALRPTPSHAEVLYHNVSGWQPSDPSVVDWETSVLDAWTAIPDCRSDTGLCPNCGVGAIVVERLDLEDKTLDLVEQRRIYQEEGLLSYRAYSVGMDGTPPPWDYVDDHTFEIASYTKVVTAFAMQVMISEGTITGNETIGRLLPECDWDAALSDEVAGIALEELRLQRSGLPAQPPNRAETRSPGGNPFGGYTLDMLCRSLVNLSGLPTRGRFSYSNYGYGILGYLLTRAERPDDPPSYEDLMKEKILLPLGMTSTTVNLEDSNAAVGCDRGLRRGQPTIRRGEYGILQGNGALRSTLRDMAKFFAAMFLIGQYRHSGWELPPEGVRNEPMQSFPGPKLVRSFLDIFDVGGAYEACVCVSDWCEGWLCPLPNPIGESINAGGATTYTSGLDPGFRKSGDTGGYSVRGAYSWAKRRAVFAVDTCGGCGSTYGASGSGVQRLVLLLADGPPPPSRPVGRSSPLPPSSGGCAHRFAGVAHSHAFPSNAQLRVEVRRPGIDGTSPATVLVASSDGQGCASPAHAIEGGWMLERSALYGCGWDPDPLANVPQSRKLLWLPDGSGAVLQEMGADIRLELIEEGGDSCPATL